MKKATYKEIPNYIRYRQPFTGNSCHADLNGSTYVIYSYYTKIAEINDFKVTYFNKNKYSSTTSKLQNIIRCIYGLTD